MAYQPKSPKGNVSSGYNELQERFKKEIGYYGRIPKWLFQAEYKATDKETGELQAKRVSAGAVMLYGWLACAYGGFDVIWPGQPRLAKELEVSTDTIQRWQDELESCGALTVTRRVGSTNLIKIEWQRREIDNV